MMHAKPEHGGVPFHSLPIGGLFFFGGQYTVSNRKTGYDCYIPAWQTFTAHIRPDILVYPDTNKYLPEAENPDGMDDCEVASLRDRTENPDLRRYCEYLLIARENRKSGDIRRAMAHEAVCQHHYDRLPENLRW